MAGNSIDRGSCCYGRHHKTSYGVLHKLLAQFKGAKIRIAYEAGPAGFNLYDDLTADGIECIVVPPSLLPVESGNRVKTDKRDSRKLAQYLENNLLKRVYVLSKGASTSAVCEN